MRTVLRTCWYVFVCELVRDSSGRRECIVGKIVGCIVPGIVHRSWGFNRQRALHVAVLERWVVVAKTNGERAEEEAHRDLSPHC